MLGFSGHIVNEVGILAKPQKWTSTDCQIRPMLDTRLQQPEEAFSKHSDKNRILEDARCAGREMKLLLGSTSFPEVGEREDRNRKQTSQNIRAAGWTACLQL